MQERSQSTGRPLLCSKELLARASRLLGNSASKRSNVAQFEPHSLRDAQRQVKREYNASEQRRPAKRQEAADSNDDYGLYFADIYRTDRHRHSYGGGGRSKPCLSAIDKREAADVSLSTVRGGHFDERSVEGLDDDRVIITYLLHALEIERLVLVNKEMVADAQAMDDEIDELERANAKLALEKARVEEERDQARLLLADCQAKLAACQQTPPQAEYTETSSRLVDPCREFERKCQELNAKMREDFFAEKSRLEVSLLRPSQPGTQTVAGRQREAVTEGTRSPLSMQFTRRQLEAEPESTEEISLYQMGWVGRRQDGGGRQRPAEADLTATATREGASLQAAQFREQTPVVDQLAADSQSLQGRPPLYRQTYVQSGVDQQSSRTPSQTAGPQSEGWLHVWTLSRKNRLLLLQASEQWQEVCPQLGGQPRRPISAPGRPIAASHTGRERSQKRIDTCIFLGEQG